MRTVSIAALSWAVVELKLAWERSLQRDMFIGMVDAGVEVERDFSIGTAFRER